MAWYTILNVLMTILYLIRHFSPLQRDLMGSYPRAQTMEVQPPATLRVPPSSRTSVKKKEKVHQKMNKSVEQELNLSRS